MFFFHRVPSLHIQHKPLEVFAFGVVDVYGVVGRLCELVQYAHAAAALRRGREHREAELLLAYSL